MGTNVDEKELSMVRKEVETESTEEVETENAKSMATEHNEKVEREVKTKNIVGRIPTGSGTVEPEAKTKGTGAEVCEKETLLHPRHFIPRFKDEYELETDSVLNEKVNRILADPSYTTRTAQSQSSSAHDVF